MPGQPGAAGPAPLRDPRGWLKVRTRRNRKPRHCASGDHRLPGRRTSDRRSACPRCVASVTARSVPLLSGADPAEAGEGRSEYIRERRPRSSSSLAARSCPPARSWLPAGSGCEIEQNLRDSKTHLGLRGLTLSHPRRRETAHAPSAIDQRFGSPGASAPSTALHPKCWNARAKPRPSCERGSNQPRSGARAALVRVRVPVPRPSRDVRGASRNWGWASARH